MDKKPELYPTLLAHADWGSHPAKRQMACAQWLEGQYYLFAPAAVTNASTLIADLADQAGRHGSVLLGFDFPIGLPLAYAAQAGIDDFVGWLPRLGQGAWADFYEVAERPEQISLHRPFYPKRPGGTKRQHLLDGLGLDSINQVRRQCDLPQPQRRAASPLFWTLGGQQVGKAAILGWRQVLVPALQQDDVAVALWPFAGDLFELFQPGRVVIAETYPAECYHHLGLTFPPSRRGRKSGKRVQADRQANAPALLDWAERVGVAVTEPLRQIIQDGFGPAKDGEDAFDAVVGLLGMLNVVLQHRPPGTPTDDRVRRIEGWILGQAYTPLFG